MPDDKDPPDYSGSLRWTSEDEAAMQAPRLDFFHGPISDCPSCKRKRTSGQAVMVTADNGARTLWEGCWECVADRLTMTPEQMLAAVAAMMAHGRKGHISWMLDESYMERVLAVGLDALKLAAPARPIPGNAGHPATLPAGGGT